MSNKDIGSPESDNEFQDALDDGPLRNLNESAIDDIIDKHSGLKLDDPSDRESGAADASGAAGEEQQKSGVEPEIIHDDINEDLLREQEKSLSANELEQNKEKADKMKLEGNELFKNGEIEASIHIYTEALKICPTTYVKERAILYGNRAAAKIKIDSKKSAIDDCSKAIELWPEYVRALMRRAKLYELEEKYDEALDDYKRAYELDPGQREAHHAMVRLPPLIQERNERMKEEMFSKLKDLGNMVLKPFGLSTSNFQMQQDPKTGSYSINFNQNSS